MALKYCDDYEELEADCCYSCHEDWGEYGYEMVMIYEGSEEVAHVCCSVADAIDKAKEVPNATNAPPG